MSKTKTLTGPERKAQILDAGAKLAAKYGVVNVQRRMVAQACKCAEALVSRYMGDTATAQAAYKRHMRKLGLVEPAKDKVEAFGVKFRAHGPRDKRDTRPRSLKEVKAIKEKRAKGPGYSVKTSTTTDGRTVVNVKATRKGVDLRKVGPLAAATRETKPAPKPASKPRETPAKPIPSPALPMPGPSEHKSAARAPKAPPSNPSS